MQNMLCHILRPFVIYSPQYIHDQFGFQRVRRTPGLSWQECGGMEENRVTDHTSHFIMRLAYCYTSELRPRRDEKTEK